MVEVSDEVGSLGEESNEEEGGEGGEEGKRVPRTRMESIRGGTSVCLTGPTCVFRCPGRPNTRVSTRRGWIKAAASYLPSSLPYGSNPRGRTRVCARVLPVYIYMRGIRWYRMLLEFLSCLPPRNKQFAQISREIIVAGLFPIPRREGIRNCRGSYCSLFVNFIRLFSLRFYTFFFFNFSRCFLDFSDLIFMYIYMWEWECLVEKLIYEINIVLYSEFEYFQVTMRNSVKMKLYLNKVYFFH